MILKIQNLTRTLFDLEFYGPVNTVYVMLSQSINLLTLFPGQVQFTFLNQRNIIYINSENDSM